MIQSLKILTLAAALTFSLFSQAKPDEKKEPFIDRMADKLELSDAQKAKFKEFQAAIEKDRKKLREELKVAREKVEGLIESNASKAEIEKAHGKIKELQAKISDLGMKARLELRELLTPAQRTKMKEFRDKMKARWEKHFGTSEE